MRSVEPFKAAPPELLQALLKLSKIEGAYLRGTGLLHRYLGEIRAAGEGVPCVAMLACRQSRFLDWQTSSLTITGACLCSLPACLCRVPPRGGGVDL